MMKERCITAIAVVHLTSLRCSAHLSQGAPIMYANLIAANVYSNHFWPLKTFNYEEQCQ